MDRWIEWAFSLLFSSKFFCPIPVFVRQIPVTTSDHDNITFTVVTAVLFPLFLLKGFINLSFIMLSMPPKYVKVAVG